MDSTALCCTVSFADSVHCRCAMQANLANLKGWHSSHCIHANYSVTVAPSWEAYASVILVGNVEYSIQRVSLNCPSLMSGMPVTGGLALDSTKRPTKISRVPRAEMSRSLPVTGATM